MIKALLWDVDGTLLDFHAAERAAVKALFPELGLGVCSDEMLSEYSRINRGFWEKLERGETVKEKMLVERFRVFFSEYGLPADKAELFNDIYQVRLGDTVIYVDDSIDIVRRLKGKVRQYAVSNGTIVAQNRKLEKSGLGELMDGIFLSEELGAEKPAREFFDRVFEGTGDTDRSEVMIVGDSLTSDIRGGMDAGILTCWYNAGGEEMPAGMRPDYVISDLHEIYGIL